MRKQKLSVSGKYKKAIVFRENKNSGVLEKKPDYK